MRQIGVKLVRHSAEPTSAVTGTGRPIVALPSLNVMDALPDPSVIAWSTDVVVLYAFVRVNEAFGTFDWMVAVMLA